MAYKLFVDSDILLDILLIREPHFNHSVSILLLRAEHKIELFTSAAIILNVNYIAQRLKDKEKAIQGVSELLKSLEIIDPSKEILAHCFNNKYPDTEDAVQYFTALGNDTLNYYLTRNTRHYNFKNISLPVKTPTQFLRLFDQSL